MPQPMLVSVNGTAVPDPFGPGFSADLGRILSDPWKAVLAQFWGQYFLNKFYWQPIGYPALTYPMGPSAQAAVEEMVNQVHRNEFNGTCPVGWPLFASGYSQGAIATGHWLRHEVLSPTGRNHNRLDDVIKRGGIINFGDPLRSPGIALGNQIAGLPLPSTLQGQVTGGIAGPDDLTPEETGDYVLSCANDGDLYASCPTGPDPKHEAAVGKVETGIFNIIQQATFLNVISIAEDLLTPVATVEAIANGMSFVVAQMGPHGDYGKYVPAMTGWLINRAA